MGQEGGTMHSLVPVACMLAGVVVLSCGSDDSGGRGSGGNGGGTSRPPDVTPPQGTECPEAAQPEVVAQFDQVVGDGTRASCSEQALRDALEALRSGEGGTLGFDCGSEPHTITLTETLFVDMPLLIDGGGTITLSGGGAVQLLNCDHYVDLAVQNITLADARTSESGSAIHLPWFGTLRVINAVFQDNECTAEQSDIGGAIFGGGLTELLVSGCTFVGNRGSNGGAVVNNGSNLKIVNSVFTNNTAFGHGGSAGDGGLGGAVYIDGMHSETADPEPFVLCGSMFRNNRSNGHGGALFGYFYPGQEATIRQCEFDSNQVLDGATGGTIYQEGAPLAVLDTLFANNTAEQHAGAMFIGTDSPTTLTNCTFYGNTVPGNAGAIFSVAQDMDITNCTFAENGADYAPAIFSETGYVCVNNTIFANNFATANYRDQSCTRTMDEGEHNLQWPDVRTSGADDMPCTDGITFADALLEPLADNGGPTRTMALGDGSPALGVGADCPETDQRGESRDPAGCDLGAYESE
jgi:hypothetical protein